MLSTVARGAVRGALAVATTVAMTVSGASVAHAAAPRLALTALSFEQSDVDVTQGFAANKLTWTVTNTDPDAESIGGTVTMRMRSSVTGALVGHDWVANYEFGSTCCSDAAYESGTPQESTYSFYLPVRQYADATTASWEVTKITIAARGTTKTIGRNLLQDYGYRFTAHTLVDSSGPRADYISLYNSHPPYLYVGDGPNTVNYDLTVQDGESGFWKGRVRFAGPHGQSISTTFTWERDSNSTGFHCGMSGGGDRDGTYMPCTVSITLPAGAAAGSWRIAALVLQNNAGGVATYKNPTAPSITVTSNETMRASDFVIDPNPVDNWRDNVRTELSMNVTGARRGVSGVSLDFGIDGCRMWGTPTVKDDGRIAVQVSVPRGATRCRVEAIAITDGAGDVSLYGTGFDAPDPGLAITQIPSTEAPVALGATLSPSTQPASEVGMSSVRLTIQAEIKVAPVDETEIHVYDADGNVVSQSFGGASQDADGTVQKWLYLPYFTLEPGEYTVGFRLTDASGLSSAWNMPDRPNSRELPGGPLVFTVTEG
ncbi:hypothetical protein [Mangrovihabitans endophyticus]|uniref:Uncharacterized protein n=1 Tax=Mangrovihabitans endophyticus TaxID=1751298 RepID=A0A8J3C0Z1_9ACTN|nr:hypothetical protein [Mangrovihabitans endophyticus]GGK94841.1 hypothetical protein GCM10012284_31120 [Mangrovihabitans endophyticus]